MLLDGGDATGGIQHDRAAQVDPGVRVGARRRRARREAEYEREKHLRQAAEETDQVPARGAADAAVVHLEHFLVGVDHEVVADADLVETVDDDGVLLAMLLG